MPSAAITLETAAGCTPTGVGSVCYRSAAGAAFDRTQDEITRLIDDDPDAPDVTVSRDDFGFTWLVVQGDPTDVGRPVHRPPRGQHAAGGAGLRLRAAVLDGAASPGTAARFGLVYLYKQGTFYAFAPTGPHQRDNLTEIAVRDQLAAELPMERDMQRWLALWDAPGL